MSFSLFTSESYVNPEAFRYLEANKPIKKVDDNLAIDDRPIVDLEGIRYLEARQISKVKKEPDVRASIDDTPIISPDAFRYLERKAEVAKLKKDTDKGPLIDETPQVDLKAFQYLEQRGIPKKVQEDGPTIDQTSIINPEAFKYLVYLIFNEIVFIFFLRKNMLGESCLIFCLLLA